MARHRADKVEAAGVPASSSEHLAVGLLSRTLSRSPTIRWILPARIRHKYKNDVVFVGEDFIHVKEYLPSGHLEDVATKADFGARIMAAKVLRSTDELAGMSFVDQVVKQEGDDHDVVWTPPEDAELPEAPHVIVLTLASKRLVFLFAQEDSLGCVHFYHAQRALPVEVASLDQQGKHLAVDPRQVSTMLVVAMLMPGLQI